MKLESSPPLAAESSTTPPPTANDNNAVATVRSDKATTAVASTNHEDDEEYDSWDDESTDHLSLSTNDGLMNSSLSTPSSLTTTGAAEPPRLTSSPLVRRRVKPHSSNTVFDLAEKKDNTNVRQRARSNSTDSMSISNTSSNPLKQYAVATFIPKLDGLHADPRPMISATTFAPNNNEAPHKLDKLAQFRNELAQSADTTHQNPLQQYRPARYVAKLDGPLTGPKSRAPLPTAIAANNNNHTRVGTLKLSPALPTITEGDSLVDHSGRTFRSITSIIDTAAIPGQRARVRFDKVEIRTYAYVLGNHPCCSPEGPPLTISWDYETEPSVNINEYEKMRLHTRRYGLKGLWITPFRRRTILLKSGVSEHDMEQACREVTRVRRQRALAIRFYKLNTWMKKKKIKKEKHANCGGVQPFNTALLKGIAKLYQ